MATLAILLAIATLSAALPQKNTAPRSYIFGEEKLEGGIFYNVNDTIVPFNDDINYRLPRTTKPLHYDLSIETNFNSPNPQIPRTISGTVAIDLVATEENVNEIVLHSSELSITALTLTYNGQNVDINEFELDSPNDENFLRVTLTQGFLEFNGEEAVYVLTILFEAPMRTDMYGIYESWFMTGGQVR